MPSEKKVSEKSSAMVYRERLAALRKSPAAVILFQNGGFTRLAEQRKGYCPALLQRNGSVRSDSVEEGDMLAEVVVDEVG
jgi:hypothetical protein